MILQPNNLHKTDPKGNPIMIQDWSFKIDKRVINNNKIQPKQIARKVYILSTDHKEGQLKVNNIKLIIF